MRPAVAGSLIVVALIILAVGIVITLRVSPTPPRPVPQFGSIRDLKPVAIPSTAPETQPPKSVSPGKPNDPAAPAEPKRN